jgi:uncharacterized protein
MAGFSGVRLAVLAKPRAKVSRVTRVDGTKVEVALAAPPVDGAANEELVRLLSQLLRVPRGEVVLVRGASSRHKLVEVRGLSGPDVVARLVAASFGVVLAALGLGSSAAPCAADARRDGCINQVATSFTPPDTTRRG